MGSNDEKMPARVGFVSISAPRAWKNDVVEIKITERRRKKPEGGGRRKKKSKEKRKIPRERKKGKEEQQERKKEKNRARGGKGMQIDDILVSLISLIRSIVCRQYEIISSEAERNNGNQKSRSADKYSLVSPFPWRKISAGTERRGADV